MKKKNNLFMISSILFVAVIFVALIYVTNIQQKTIAEVFPDGDKYVELEVDGDVTELDYENQPSLGEKDAPVKLAMFGDYKCSHCHNWDRQIFPQIFDDYVETGIVEFHFFNKQFMGLDSILSGIAGESIHNQSEESFWEFHHELYSRQEMVSADQWGTPSRLLAIAEDSITNEDFDFEQLEQDISEFNYIEEVKRDDLIGTNNGVTGTPSLFINGTKVDAFDYDLIQATIEELVSEND